MAEAWRSRGGQIPGLDLQSHAAEGTNPEGKILKVHGSSAVDKTATSQGKDANSSKRRSGMVGQHKENIGNTSWQLVELDLRQTPKPNAISRYRRAVRRMNIIRSRLTRRLPLLGLSVQEYLGDCAWHHVLAPSKSN